MCITMLPVFMLFTTLGTTFAGYAGSSSNDVDNGYGYGYSGSFSGTGANVPIPPIPNFDFGGALSGYFDSLQKYHENFISTLQQQAQQAQQIGAQNGAYAPGYASYGSVPNIAGRGSFGDQGGAVASASIGPQGGYHTAAVYPENPNSPNIVSRFAETGQPGGGGGGGSYGVFTSSVSSSSNADGKPQSFHRATTTINDNGKVSTYTVKNP